MSLISYIKRDRQMDFNHWRYRLLHWTFGIKPNGKSDSPLPDFFYTHYCPLFHFTNILAIIFPIVFLVKFIVGSAKALFFGSVSVFNTVWPIVSGPFILFAKKMDEKREANLKAYMSSDKYKERERKKKEQEEIQELKRAYRIHDDNVKYIRNYVIPKFEVLSEEKANKIFDKIVAKEKENLKKAKERQLAAEKRKKEMQERFVFWIRFSQVFVKGLTGVVLFAASCALLVGLYLIIPPLFELSLFALASIWSGLVWLFGTVTSISITGLLSSIAQGIIGVAVVAALTAGIIFIGMKAWDHIARFFEVPRSICKQMVEATGNTVVNTVGGVGEFISALYEDNCPAITIVSDDDLLEDDIQEDDSDDSDDYYDDEDEYEYDDEYDDDEDEDYDDEDDEYDGERT